MFRCVLFVAIAVSATFSGSPVHAQWMTNFWDSSCRDYHRNKAWPEPFLMPDRAAASMPFAIQVANGWRRQNLMSDYHFDEETNRLNQAGEMKLRFILTQMPPSRRTVFVQRGLTPDVTSDRLAAVERESGRIAPNGNLGGIVESDLPNDGWPADEIDAITRGFNKTRPDPRLKDVSGADSSSAGSGNSN